QAGKTYVAHYSLSQNGIRVQSIVDVVHMPIQLNAIAKDLVLPALSTDKLTVRNAFAKRDVQIGSNVFHRYLVAVDSQDTALIISAGIQKPNTGAILVTAYDPDGKELEYKVTGNSNEVEMGSSSSTTISVDTREKPGIYEITVATSASGWMAPSIYDLLIRTRRVDTSNGKSVVNVDSGGKVSIGVLHPMNESEKVEVRGLLLEPVENLELVVIPSRWTFHKINIPEGTTSIQVEADDDEDSSFFGAIVPHLFKNINGETPDLITKLDVNGKNLSLNFSLPPPPSTLAFPESAFIAVETFGVVRENGQLKDASTKLPIRVSYSVKDNKSSLKTKVIKEVSSRANTILEISAPELSSPAYTEMMIEINGSSVKVPVLVSPKK
ncbi:hypothetical protein GW915_11410, partial [bacterium]|nr:hypothetical protein [bacterium]